MRSSATSRIVPRQIGECQLLRRSCRIRLKGENSFKNVLVSNVQVTFRMKFVRTGIHGSDSKIGNDGKGIKHLIQMLVLDTTSELCRDWILLLN